LDGQAAEMQLLLPPGLQNTTLDFDQFQRYRITARLLDRMLAGLGRPVRILEVGSNVLNLLPRFLNASRVQVIRCDVSPCVVDPDFVLVEKNQALPFAAESFDAVVALEVLEHIPAEGRRPFVAECLRVARQGAIFSCPNGSPEVVEVEALAAAAFQERQGRPHPFLGEHQAFGLPREEEVRAWLREFDYPHAVFDNAPLDVWLGMVLVSENLSEQQAVARCRSRLLEPFLEGRRQGGMIPYRKVYVCAKTFDATAALEPLPEESFLGEDPSPFSFPVAALHQLSLTVADVLIRLERDHRRETAQYQEQISALLQALTDRDNEVRSWEHQTQILTAVLRRIERSWSWNLLRPLWALRRFFKPRTFNNQTLIPHQHLEPVTGAPPGTWLSLGGDPQFLFPCPLPAGWVRFRVRMTTKVWGHFEIYVDGGSSFLPAGCIERRFFRDNLDVEFFVHLPSPVRALRFDPLDSDGEFQIHTFNVEPLSRPRVFWHAIWGKLQKLREVQRTRSGLRKGLSLLLHGQLDTFADKLLNGLDRPALLVPGQFETTNEVYEAWRERRRLTDAHREQMRAETAAMTKPPLISVLMPVYNVPETYLRLAIESVLRQTYPHWELCIADDHSTVPHIRPVLEEYARRDPRIKIRWRSTRGNIAAASNSALTLASGDYIALLDNDDELAEQALFKVAKTIVANRDLDMIYSDEDKLELDGRHVDPFFKPDWSPEYFQACMYTCHLGVYRTALVRELGGFRSAFDTAQDYDLALRIVARSHRIAHIPDVLYHWRKLPTSTAVSNFAKPQAAETARRALENYLETIGRPGTVEPGPVTGFHRIRFALIGQPKISIVIPTACRKTVIDGEETTYIAACVESIRSNSTYPNYEIVVVDNDDMPAELESELEQWQIRRIAYTEPFNLAAKINLGAAKATGDYLVLLNDDITVIAPDWLECLLEYAQQPEIGAVGAKLLFPNGRLQHIGVTILDGNPGHPFYGFPGQFLGYFCGGVVPRNYSAVTGACLMTPAEVFQSVGGFDEDFPLNYNDVDFCLKVAATGRRIVYTPYAQLYHHESVSKAGVYPEELAAFKQRWGEQWRHDPFYNPNLSVHYHDYRIEVGEAVRFQV
jgi:glycosyltransferase involved in cell wall biosynthesis